MLLREELERSGTWLFRWRSFLPLLVLLPIVAAFRDFEYPFRSHRMDLIWEIVCLTISLLGLSIRICTIGFVPKGTSGRNTRRVKGDLLNKTGMYSIVRHPLYLGNFFIGLGISLFLHLWWFTLLFALVFWLYYERIIFAEEEFLRKKFQQVYVEWANATPAFIPQFRVWKPPELPFSLRTALKGEYGTFMAIITTFTFLEILGDFFAEGEIVFDLLWATMFLMAALLYGTVRIIHKKTRILKAKGR